MLSWNNTDFENMNRILLSVILISLASGEENLSIDLNFLLLGVTNLSSGANVECIGQNMKYKKCKSFPRLSGSISQISEEKTLNCFSRKFERFKLVENAVEFQAKQA